MTALGKRLEPLFAVKITLRIKALARANVEVLLFRLSAVCQPLAVASYLYDKLD